MGAGVGYLNGNGETMGWKSLTQSLVVLLLLCSFGGSLAAQQPVEYREMLQGLSDEINAQMEELKQSSRALTDSLQIADSRLQMLSSERDSLKAALLEYSSSLTSTNELLSSYSTRLIQYEQKLRDQKELITKLIVGLVIFGTILVVVGILEIKEVI